jgi:hypothetical protein
MQSSGIARAAPESFWVSVSGRFKGAHRQLALRETRPDSSANELQAVILAGGR